MAVAEALHLIKDTTASTMVELRRTVALLRAADRPSRDTATLSNIGSLIELGSEVEFTMDIRVPDGLSSIVDAAAFRIIQESVTNIVKHSTATRARIEAGRWDGGFHVSVVDNGRRRAHGTVTASGHGLDGMRERTAVLGGTLEAVPVADGFAVRATIPLGSRP